MTLPIWWSDLLNDLQRLSESLIRLARTEALGGAVAALVASARGHLEHVFSDEEEELKYRSFRSTELSIIPPANRQLHPRNADVQEASLKIVYECFETTERTDRFGCDDLDRIRKAEFQVRVKGLAQFGSTVVTLEDHWRMDTHHFITGEPSEPHPLFHFQRGGHAQDSFANETGFIPGPSLGSWGSVPSMNLCGLMQTPAPRVASPPMDPICAIDFVIAQHDGTVWSLLWSQPEYADIVRRAQERLWKPFFELLANRAHRRRLMPFYGAPSPRTL